MTKLIQEYWLGCKYTEMRAAEMMVLAGGVGQGTRRLSPEVWNRGSALRILQVSTIQVARAAVFAG